jgi:hypothetical protein
VVEDIVQGGGVTQKKSLIDMILGFVGAIAKATDIDLTAKYTETRDVGSDASHCFIWSGFNGTVRGDIPQEGPMGEGIWPVFSR